MSNKLNLMVELRRKYAARVLQRWVILTRNRVLVRSVLQVKSLELNRSSIRGQLVTNGCPVWRDK